MVRNPWRVILDVDDPRANTITDEEWFDYMTTLFETDERGRRIASLSERLNRYGINFRSRYALFSSFLPEDFFYNGPSPDPGFEQVVIKEGIMVKGTLTKSHLGPKRNSIVHKMAIKYTGIDIKRTAIFITDASRVLDIFLRRVGFSMGLSDCMSDDPRLQEQLESENLRTNMITQSIGLSDNPLEMKAIEGDIVAELNRTQIMGTKILNVIMEKWNRFAVSVASGAKGKKFNIMQATFALGQIFIGGGRPERTLRHGTRSSPYYEPMSNDPESRGYCAQGFNTGLSPSNFIYHHTAAREGLLDTALGTAKPGKLTRYMTKMSEDIMIKEDGSVRDQRGRIIQEVFGYDGLDPSNLVRVTVDGDKKVSFIDLETEVASLNAQFGYYDL
jgi:DNA-directed RNA polymerase beta' subunit